MKIQLNSVGMMEVSYEPQAAGASIEVPCMLVYEGNFQSGGGPVEITEDHLVSICANHNTRLTSLMAKLGLMAEQLPCKYVPPVQLDHSTSAVHTVGRLVGPVHLALHTLEDGSTRRSLHGTMRILGKENVEKVLDGRWTHLSIGADLDEGKIDELTITPFPAAKEASMLSSSKNVEYGGASIELMKTQEGAWVWTAVNQEGKSSSEAEALKEAKMAVDKFNKKNLSANLSRISYKDWLIEAKEIGGGKWGAIVSDGYEGEELPIKASSKSEAIAKAKKFIDENDTTDLSARLAKLSGDDRDIEYKGCVIEIRFPRGSASVRIVDPNGDTLARKALFLSVYEAISWAKKKIDSAKLSVTLAAGKILNIDDMMVSTVPPGAHSGEGWAVEITSWNGHMGDKNLAENDGFNTANDAVDWAKKQIPGLKKKHKLQGVRPMLAKLKAFLMGKKKLSEADADAELAKMSEEEQAKMAAEMPAELSEEEQEKLSKMKKRLMDDEKLTAEEAEEKLSKMNDDDKTALAAKCSDDNTELSDDELSEEELSEEESEKAQMSAAEKSGGVHLSKETKVKLTGMITEFNKKATEVRLSVRKVQLSARLNSLKSSAKVTPAEMKKLDMTKLSKMSDEAVEAVFQSYESREPVILTGAIGSVKSINLAEIQAKTNKARLEAEVRGNMSLKKKTVQLSEDEIRANEEEVRVASFAKEPIGYDQLAELIDKGDKEAAKVALRATLSASPQAGTDVQGLQQELTALAEGYAKLQGQFQELVKLVQ